MHFAMCLRLMSSFLQNANMHGGRTPINQRRTGANPTQQLRVKGSPMGTDPTQMYGPGQAVPGYNNPAMQTAHRNDRMGLLNPPSLLSSSAAFHPNQSPMAQPPQQAQYFGNMPSQDYFNSSMMPGMQQHANSGYGQTVQLPTVYQVRGLVVHLVGEACQMVHLFSSVGTSARSALLGAR